MATINSISRQPDKLDFTSPTQFKLVINQLPKVEFFAVTANIPAITLGDAVFPTPFKEIPIMGDTVTYDNFEMSFQVDEYLENYVSMHEWITAIGFPKNRTQFSSFRSATSTTPNTTKGISTDIGDVKPATPANPLFSDMTLTILSNKNNPIVEVRFQDAYPVALSGLDYSQQATDVEYIQASASFTYKLYEIITLP